MTDERMCGICGADTAAIQALSHGIFRVNCERCGDFAVTREAKDDWRDGYLPKLSRRQLANASAWVRENPGVLINGGDLDRLASLAAPSVQERADKLLRELAKQSSQLGTAISISLAVDKNLPWLAITWSASDAELHFLLAMCLAPNHFVTTTDSGNVRQAIVTAPGYAHLESLRSDPGDGVLGFCAMRFHESTDALWQQGLEPAVIRAGYEPKRIDRVDHNNRIDDEIISMLRKSRFVVADFTGQRGGVYFEAGFALGLGKQVIWTVEESELSTVHFDTRQYNFITWSAGAFGAFVDRLAIRIEATVGRPLRNKRLT